MTEPRRKNIKQHTPHWKEEVCHSTAWASLRHLQMLDITALQVRNACLQRIKDSRDKLVWDKRAGKAQQQVMPYPFSCLMWQQIKVPAPTRAPFRC